MGGPEIPDQPHPVYDCLCATVEKIAGEILLNGQDIETSLFGEGTSVEFWSVIDRVTYQSGIRPRTVEQSAYCMRVICKELGEIIVDKARRAEILATVQARKHTG